MHSVQRSPEPGFFEELRAAYSRWKDLDGASRIHIRNALAQDFGPICVYCERPCQPKQPRTQTEDEETSHRPNDETIDHFRPRSRFPHLWLDWLNLVYACHRCNQLKGDSWPGCDATFIHQLLTAENSRYTPASEYGSPTQPTVRGRRVSSLTSMLKPARWPPQSNLTRWNGPSLAGPFETLV